MYKNNSTKVWLVINFLFIYSDFKTNPDKKIVLSFDLHMIPLEDYFFYLQAHECSLWALDTKDIFVKVQVTIEQKH